MVFKSIRVGNAYFHTPQHVKEKIQKLAEENNTTVSKFLGRLVDEYAENKIHFAERCGQPVQMPDNEEEQKNVSERIIDGLEDFIDEAKTMDRKTAIEMLIDLSHKKKKEVKAANDSGMYGPDSWVHFLETATQKGAPPEEVACEAIRHFQCMILAARYRGENPDYVRLALRNLHLSKGRGYTLPNRPQPVTKFGSERPWGIKPTTDEGFLERRVRKDLNKV